MTKLVVLLIFDIVNSNTIYSIDILTYPVPTSLPSGITSSIIFPSVAKNLILKIPSGMNDILGYDIDFQTDAASEIKTYNSTIRFNCMRPSSKSIF